MTAAELPAIGTELRVTEPIGGLAPNGEVVLYAAGVTGHVIRRILEDGTLDIELEDGTLVPALVPAQYEVLA